MTTGLHNILRGILLYRKTIKGTMVGQFQRIRDNPQVCFSLVFLNGQSFRLSFYSLKRCFSHAWTAE